MMRGANSRRERARSTGGRNRRRLLLEPLCDRRVLAAITGAVFDDVNESARRDVEEAGLEDRLVYLDSNDDGQLSEGEPYRLTDGQGQFAFDALGLGDYSVRLYNGTASQRQTMPVKPQWAETIELKDAVISASSNDQSQLYLRQGDSVVQWDLETGESSSIDLPAPIASLHPLPDGRVVALGEADAGLSGDAAWLLSFDDESVDVVDFGLAEDETGWSSMAIDGAGNGVLLAAHSDGEPTPVRQLLWSDGNVQATPSNNSVAAGATALSHGDAVTSLIAVPSGEGLLLTQWSNTSGTLTGTSTEVPDGSGLLAFDEVAGLAIVEASDGDLLVLDASANMALLNRFTDLEGPIELDGHRERLYAIDDAGDFVVQDLLNPATRQTVPMSEAAVGGMVLVEGGRAAIVGHSEHLRRIRLDRPGGYSVSLRQGQESADLLFGLYVDGDNEAPAYPTEPMLDLNEDATLNLAAPALLNEAVDPDEGDHFVLLRSTDPSLGAAQTSPAGRLHYQPAENLNGSDSFDVLLHDGRSVSEAMTVHLDIRPVDDPPGPAIFIGPTAPEDMQPGVALGTITIVNPDAGEILNIEVAHDHRFLVDGDRLILAEGAQLDYESEPRIDLDLLITDEESGEEAGIRTIMLQVGDAPEEITGIDLEGVNTIDEGIYTGSMSDSEATRVATVVVNDLDEGGTYTFDPSDPRFEVVDGELRIVPDAEFNYEQEPSIELTIGVDEVDGPFDFSETFTLRVTDLNEAPTTASFSADTISERVAGVSVGEVSVDDPDEPSTVNFSVDDSRFEFDGPTLKLRDGVFVERAQQEQIQLTLTVADYAETEFVRTIDVTLEVLENGSPFHNDDLHGDVNGDGHVEPRDALVIINYLNRFGPGPIEEAVNSGHAEYYYDVNDDGLVTPLDALLVINHLNQEARDALPTVGGEGETGLAFPLTEPEGEQEDQEPDHASPAERSSLVDGQKLGTRPFGPARATITPARATDLAVEALSKETDSPTSRDAALSSLCLASDRLANKTS